MQKTCVNCSAVFQILPEDQEFYTKIEVPEPTRCPDCSRQRRNAFRNERNLYKHQCNLCKKSMISVFDINSQYMPYCSECWWSDKWDPMNYGRKFDFSRSFFDQFSEFQKSIPHVALMQDGTSENCEYVNYGGNNTSCYLALCFYSEDVYYSHTAAWCKSCVDVTKCIQCELCYECIDCFQGYSLFFSQDCNGCANSYFLKNCTGCKNCFCSAGLRNQKYVFENKQFSKKEYEQKMQTLKLTLSKIKEWKNKRDAIALRIPHKYMHGVKNENVTGDYIDQCKDLYECYDCLDMQNSQHCDTCGDGAKDMHRCSYSGSGAELCYELNGTTGFHNCKCCYFGRYLQNSSYCQYCYNSSYLFGCVGLKNKKYCIFNTQYTKKKYEELVSQIIKHMTQAREWGEFFPIHTSPFSYNETVSYEYLPMKKDEVIMKGWKWKENTIQDISEKPSNAVIICEKSKKPFLLQKKELEFYQTMNLPIPNLHPEVRHKMRFDQRNPRKLHDRECRNCRKIIRTTYAKDRPEAVYCKKCYVSKAF